MLPNSKTPTFFVAAQRVSAGAAEPCGSPAPSCALPSCSAGSPGCAGRDTELPARALRAVRGEQGEGSAVSPHSSTHCPEYRSRTVLFAACPGFVSEDHCPEPFIATVWDSVPGPAPYPAEGLPKSYGCALQLQGEPLCRSNGRRMRIPALKPGREAEFSDNQSQANNYRQSYHKVVSVLHQARHPAPAQIRANPTKAA